MEFNRANAVQLVVAGIAFIAVGAMILAFGLSDGHAGYNVCGTGPCPVISQPVSADKIVGGAVMMALGAAALGTGGAYVLGDARPQPTSSPDSQD